MKKFIAILLVLAMVFAFAACGAAEEPVEETAETLTTIPLGDSLSIDLEGKTFGEYVLIDTPAFLTEQFPECEIACYYAKGSDTPYIITYRYANTKGTTIEEEFAANCKNQGVEYYQFKEDGLLGSGKEGYCNYSWDLSSEDMDGQFFYVATCQALEGDHFVAIDFLSAAEELALGDSGKYLWIPSGYESDLTAEELAEHNVFLSASYEESYYMPYIFVGQTDSTYEGLQWFWADGYPDGLPFDEATWQGWIDSNWSKASVDAYYKAVGLDIEKSGEAEVDGCPVYFSAGTHTEGDQTVLASESHLHIGDKDYTIWISTGLDPAPAYAKAICESLHSK